MTAETSRDFEQVVDQKEGSWKKTLKVLVDKFRMSSEQDKNVTRSTSNKQQED